MTWRTLIFENYKAKIALFLMAVFMWFFVVSHREYIQVMKVPVRAVNLSSGRMLRRGLPPFAEVRFRGRGTSLLLLSLFGDPSLKLDLSLPGDFHVIHPSLELVDWSSAIEVQALDVVSPDSILVELENRPRSPSRSHDRP